MPVWFRLRMRKAQIYLSRRNNLAWAALATYIGALAVFSVVGNRGLVRSYHLWKEGQRIEEQNRKLEQENVTLSAEVKKYRNNLKTIEQQARQELHLAGDHEIQYIFHE